MIALPHHFGQPQLRPVTLMILVPGKQLLKFNFFGLRNEKR